MIKVNGNIYDPSRVELLHREGIRIKITLDEITNLETAVQGKDTDTLCVMAQGDKYFCLIKPAKQITDNTPVYLMSKIILKKCKTDVIWETARPQIDLRRPPMRRSDTSYGQQNRQRRPTQNYNNDYSDNY